MPTTIDDGTISFVRLLKHVSITRIVLAIILSLLLRRVNIIIRRIYKHPLSHFPGPKFDAASRIPQIYSDITGTAHVRLCRLHAKYGDAVRVSPNEISFIGPQAWKDVHGYATKATTGSLPHKHWGHYGTSANGSSSLLNARDADHVRMRRIFNPAFSDRALKQQEPLFLRYADLLVQKLKEQVRKDLHSKFDMVRMYNFTTFDIMGDLTFGEPLHMLTNAEYDPWVSLIFKYVKVGTRLKSVEHYPSLASIIKSMIPDSFARKRFEHVQFAVQRVTKRLEKGRDTEGIDLWDLVLNQEESKGLSRKEMDANASLFMVAGTETTASLLSGLTYLLLKDPRCMQKLTEEIRGKFSDSQDMRMENLAALPYLNACIKEGLRLYPPFATGFPRLVPSEGSMICGEFVPPGFAVTVPHLAMYTSERNFGDPWTFAPERWLDDERYKSDQKACLQPFSFGSRNCLGKNMANHEMRLILAKILYNFDLELCPESADWREDQKTYLIWEKPPLNCHLKPVT